MSGDPGYDVGYRDGENNRSADATIFHEEVLGHDPDCRCPLGQFLTRVADVPADQIEGDGPEEQIWTDPVTATERGYYERLR
jgi:hypothetical protein